MVKQPKQLNNSSPKSLQTILNQLRGAYQGWDEIALKLYVTELTAMIGEFGDARVGFAVTKLIRERPDFRPTIATIRQRIPSRDPNEMYCAACRNLEGWLHVMVEGEKVARLYRCKHESYAVGQQIRVRIGAWGLPDGRYPLPGQSSEVWATIV